MATNQTDVYDRVQSLIIPIVWICKKSDHIQALIYSGGPYLTERVKRKTVEYLCHRSISMGEKRGTCGSNNNWNVIFFLIVVRCVVQMDRRMDGWLTDWLAGWMKCVEALLPACHRPIDWVRLIMIMTMMHCHGFLCTANMWCITSIVAATYV